jgi:hypothetical protein
LLLNDLIIVRNHGDDEEDKRDIKRVLERHGDAHIKVEIQSNFEILEFDFESNSEARTTTALN